MAFTDQEKEIIRAGASLGKTKQQVWDALNKHRQGFVPSQPLNPIQPEKKQEKFQRIKDAPSDIKEGFQNVIQGSIERTDSIKKGIEEGQSPISTVAQIGSGIAGTMSDIIGEGVVTGAKLFATPEQEEKIAQRFQKTIEAGTEKALAQEPVAKTVDAVSSSWDYLQTESPEAARTLRSFAGAGSLALDIVTFGAFNRVMKEVGKKAKSLDEYITKVDEVIKENPTTPRTPESPVTLPEGVVFEEPVQLTLLERFAGVRPDIKQRITGKYELLSDYFTVAHARNGDIPSYNAKGDLLQADTQPTPLGYAAQVVRQTYDDITDELFKTGSDIGETRKKLATTVFTVDQVATIEKKFTDLLEAKDLQITNGVVNQKRGTISKLRGTNDLNVIQEIYDDLLTFKQAPNLKNGIDLRSAVDSNINFNKSAGNVSNSVDPFSRQLRKVIATEAEKVVGKEEAAKIAKYSDLMDEYKELERYVNRNAGEEYLLRLLLSGRGREAAELVNAVKDITGVDLYDHAVMSTLATDLIGNVNQKNLFRQEVTRAGLDASRALSGDPTGVLNIISDKATDAILDEEKIFLRAAGAPRDFELPKQTVPAGAAAGGALLAQDDEGNFILNPGYAAIIGGLSNKAARQAITDSIKQLDDARNSMSARGLKDSHPSMKANQKARDSLIKEREQLDANE